MKEEVSVGINTEQNNLEKKEKMQKKKNDGTDKKKRYK